MASLRENYAKVLILKINYSNKRFANEARLYYFFLHLLRWEKWKNNLLLKNCSTF